MASLPDEKNITIDTLVHAVQWGDLPTVERAVEELGFSPDTCDQDGCSLLHWAAINNRLSIAKYLVGKGANVAVTGGNNKENPLQWCIRSSSCSEILCYFLTEESSIVDKSIYGCDALMIAVQSEQLNAAFILLNAGADPNTVDNNSDTPLYWLLRKYVSSPTLESVEMQRLLLRFRASVTHKAKDGCNAMHILAAAGQKMDLPSALSLYLAGDDTMMEAKNAENLTPQQVAVRAKNSGAVRLFYDAHMYRKYHYHAPTAMVALTFVSAFVFLHQLGWMYGTLAFIPLFLACETMSQPYVHAGASRLPCGLAWGVIVSAFSCYFLLLSRHFGFLVHFIAVAYCACITYTLLRTMGTPPQHVYADSADSRNQLVQKIVEAERSSEEMRFCTTCLVDRSLATMHCSKCNKCVVSLDHHCPFVCNCVGRGNRRMFVLFLLSAATGCMYFVLLSLYAQYAVYCPTEVGRYGRFVAVQVCMFQNLPAVLAVTVVTGLTSMWIAALFLGQMGLVASETTTYEVMKHKNRGVDMFTARGLRNLLLFFYTGTYSIVSAPPLMAASLQGGCGGHEGGACNHAHHSHSHAHSEAGDGKSSKGAEHIV